MNLAFDIDGIPAEMEVDNLATLQEVLQAKDHSRPGIEPPCATGTCSACTVLLDGAPVLSCLTLAATCRDRHVVTAAGLLDPKLKPLKSLFVRMDIEACGACASGILVSASSLLRANPRPTRSDVRHALAGHVCRCLSYSSIIDAVIAAGELPNEAVAPHQALPSQNQINAALSDQQAFDPNALLEDSDPLDTLRSRLTDAATSRALDQAVDAFDWQSRRKTAQMSAKRQLSAAATAMVEQSDVTSIALVDLEFDAETAIVSLRKVAIVAAAASLPPGCTEISEAAVMDAIFIALRRGDANRNAQFPKDFPSMVQSASISIFVAARGGDARVTPMQFRHAVCLSAVCAIGGAIGRALHRRLPAPPFTPDRLLAPPHSETPST